MTIREKLNLMDELKATNDEKVRKFFDRKKYIVVKKERAVRKYEAPN